MSEAAAFGAGPNEFALIIGAMKSGTTSLFEQLAQHPEIAPSSVKEPGFFSDAAVHARGVDWYRSLWSWDPTTHRIALEASTAYTTYPARPGVPERIAAVPGASFRFIYMTRNPLAQIESNVRHTLYVGWGRPLDEGVPDWMIDTVRYAMQLDRFLAVFPRDRLLVLTLEEFERDPATVLRRVCGFLGVRDDYPFRDPAERYNTGDVYEISGGWARVVKFGPARWLAARLLPRALRHRVRALLPKLSAGRKAELGRYKLKPEERSLVLGQLDEDLRRLEAQYGVPVTRDWFPDLAEAEARASA